MSRAVGGPGPGGSHRSGVRAALALDRDDWRYRRLWLPLLAVQSVLYTGVLARFVDSGGAYAPRPTAELPLLRENHIGNLVSIESPIDPTMLGIHVLMAWFWIVAVIGQKELARRMGATAPDDHAAFARFRRIHAVVGSTLLLLGFVGILVAPVIALLHHGNPPMKWFLVAQIGTFLPPMLLLTRTVLDRRSSMHDHRFWAEFAFVGPAVASVWTEAGIHVTGRSTSLGPNRGELWSSVVGGALGFLLVVGPAFAAWRRGKAGERGAAPGPAPHRAGGDEVLLPTATPAV